MQIDLPIKESDYVIKQVKQNDGTFLITVSPKKRKCKICNKEFDSNNTQFLMWQTQEGYSVKGWLCRKHYYQAKKLIDEILKEK